MTARQVAKQFAGYVGSGLIAIFPAAMTIWVISAVVRWLAEMFGPQSVIGKLLAPRDASPLQHGLIMATVYLVALLGIGLLGYRTQRRASSWIVGAVNSLFSRFPIVNRIYRALQQAANVMRSQTGEDSQGIAKFGDVAFVRFSNLHLLAVLTSRRVYRINGKAHVQVFLPTAPVPATGFLYFAPIEDVVITGLDIEAYTKIDVSFGALTAQTIPPSMRTFSLRVAGEHSVEPDTPPEPAEEPQQEPEPKPKRKRKPKVTEPTEEAPE